MFKTLLALATTSVRTAAGVTFQITGLVITVISTGFVMAGQLIQRVGVNIEGEKHFTTRMSNAFKQTRR